MQKRTVKLVSDEEKRLYAEFIFFKRLITEVYPSGIVSIVSDTYDYWSVLTKVVPSLKKDILSREGKIVIRPDSGNPVKIVCGDPHAEPRTPEYKGTVELLWETFGGTHTETGHKLLDEHIGVIYGDSITPERAEAIIEGLKVKGFASGNIVFGIGSFTYQYNTRDTFGFAMKATWCQINDKGVDMFKEPKTDDGTKNSAKGLLAVVRGQDGELELINQATKEQQLQSLLKPVWRDGKFLKQFSLEQIRNNAAEIELAMS